MSIQIRAAELCVRTWPAEDRLVAIVSGYFDDSRTDGTLWVLGGFAGYINQWEHFEELWRAALDTHGVPYFHMREMADPNGVFKKWHPAENHQDEVIAFFKDLIAAIKKSYLHQFGSAVWVRDLDRFNSEKNCQLKPYSLAAYSCLTRLSQRYPAVPATAIFDRIEKIDSRLATARTYADSDKFVFPGACDHVTSAPLAPGLTAKNVPAMQAADLIVWEARRAYLTIHPWQSLPDRPQPQDRDAQWEDFRRWSRDTHNKEYPIQRRSLEALIDNMPISWTVWDYLQLCTTHDARRGIWKQEDV